MSKNSLVATGLLNEDRYQPESVRIGGKLHREEIQTEDHMSFTIDIPSLFSIPLTMYGNYQDSWPSPTYTLVPVNEVLHQVGEPAGPRSQCDIIFFHGTIFAEDDHADWQWKTWLTESTDNEGRPWPCMATWLRDEFPQARVFTVDYGPCRNLADRNEEHRVLKLAEKLARKLTFKSSDEQSPGLGTSRCTVLVGHGKGGSVIKHMLLKMESIAGRWDEAEEELLQATLRRFLSSIKGVYFYASSDPYDGNKKAQARKRSSQDLLGSSTLPIDLTALRTNEEFRTFRSRRKIKTYELTLRPLSDGNGSEKSKIVAAPYDVDNYQVAEEGARYDTICRPKDKADNRYKTLKRFIAGVLIIGSA